MAAALTVVIIVILWLVFVTQGRIGTINGRHQRCQEATAQLQQASDLLTAEARLFASTGERIHLDSYLAEYLTDNNRGKALQTLRESATSNVAVSSLEKASSQSDELAQVELRALRLKTDALDMGDVPAAIEEVVLDEGEASLPASQKDARSRELLNDTSYTNMKLAIHDNAQNCSQVLIDSFQADLKEANTHLDTYLLALLIGVLILLMVLGLVILSTKFLLLWPIEHYESSIRADKLLEPGGAQELRYLTIAYNDIFAQNHERQELLAFEAHNDPLTGVLNRGSFNELLTRYKGNCALILVDVDCFKAFNDEWGHEMGDAILTEVAATLFASFRSSDYICRIGGDEFAVIMTDMRPDQRAVIERKVTDVAEFLRDTSNGLPAATISVGIAFGFEGCVDDMLFQLADSALYEVKRRGRNSYAFAEQSFGM